MKEENDGDKLFSKDFDTNQLRNFQEVAENKGLKGGIVRLLFIMHDISSTIRCHWPPGIFCIFGFVIRLLYNVL
jgi:hypothetical protein